METRGGFIRGLLLMGGVFGLIFVAEFFVEWYAAGSPGLDALSWEGNQFHNKMVDVLSPMARAYNNVLAMLIATIGLAIPLTANMHTPKLIDMFLRDWTNRIMLGLFAFGAANVLFVAFMIGPGFAPMWTFRVAVVGALVGWAVLIPYFFYVVRFLDPSNILARLKNEVQVAVSDVESGKRDPAAAREAVHERLHQIGTIVLKSIDRADRSVVTEGIWTIKQILDHYGERKGRLPEAWFRVERKDFVGLAAEAIEILVEDKTWFEHRALTQLYLAYQSALAKTADAVSSLSDATRVIATTAAARGDENAADLAVKYFNNFLREAIKRKDLHAIYDLFYQFRALGRDLRDDAHMLRQIGRYFMIYSTAAINAGLPFAAQIAGFDLGWLVRRAYDVKSPAAPELLDDELRLDHNLGGKPAPLLIEAKVILGAALVEAGLEAEADRVRQNLRDVPNDTLAHVEKDLLGDTERSFWEVTDRQVNFQWVKPERRPFLASFIASVRALDA